MKISSKIIQTPLLRLCLKPAGKTKRPPLTTKDWLEFKILHGPKCKSFCHPRRKTIKKDTSKWPEEFTFDEFLEYHKPNSSAPCYLKELWSQLTLEEQELVKKFQNDWAFIFPATFETQRQLRAACAFRLERLFGRKFYLKKARTKKIEHDDEKFGKLVEGCMFES